MTPKLNKWQQVVMDKVKDGGKLVVYVPRHYGKFYFFKLLEQTRKDKRE